VPKLTAHNRLLVLIEAVHLEDIAHGGSKPLRQLFANRVEKKLRREGLF
jgi:hypothetical protein